MSSAVLSKIFRKLPSLLGFGLGGYAGHNMAQWEMRIYTLMIPLNP